MLKIKATDEQMRKMAAAAVNASIPTGMGFMHYDGSVRYTAEQIEIDAGSIPGIFLDYVGGRMVKLSAWKKEGYWEVADRKLDHEYQSWCGQYESWQALAKSVDPEIVIE